MRLTSSCPYPRVYRPPAAGFSHCRFGPRSAAARPPRAPHRPVAADGSSRRAPPSCARTPSPARCRLVDHEPGRAPWPVRAVTDPDSRPRRGVSCLVDLRATPRARSSCAPHPRRSRQGPTICSSTGVVVVRTPPQPTRPRRGRSGPPPPYSARHAGFVRNLAGVQTTRPRGGARGALCDSGARVSPGRERIVTTALSSRSAPSTADLEESCRARAGPLLRGVLIASTTSSSTQHAVAPPRRA